jgi:hypothetical protein
MTRIILFLAVAGSEPLAAVTLLALLIGVCAGVARFIGGAA